MCRLRGLAFTHFTAIHKELFRLIRVLVVLLGLGLLGFGIYRANTNTRTPLRRGNTRAAVNIFVTSLGIAALGLTLLIVAMTWSALWFFGALLIAIPITVAVGTFLYRNLLQQLQGHD